MRLGSAWAEAPHLPCSASFQGGSGRLAAQSSGLAVSHPPLRACRGPGRSSWVPAALLCTLGRTSHASLPVPGGPLGTQCKLGSAPGCPACPSAHQ